MPADHFINFGLSVGFFRNSIDLTKYYNDPTYVQDRALMYGQEQSKIKFATDISALYRYKTVAEAGILFSNVMFGTVKYANSDMTYKPLKNYLLHASYLFVMNNQLGSQTHYNIKRRSACPNAFRNCTDRRME